MRTTRALLACLVLLGPATGVACRRTPPARITAANVERCERGIEDAVRQKSSAEAAAVYYRECSEIQAEAPCRQAFISASKTEPDKQLVVALEGCAAAYCTLLSSEKLEACRPGFQPTPEALWRAWPPLHKAILARDAGVYAPRIERALLQFLVGMKSLPSAPSAAPVDAAAPASDGAVAAGDAAPAAEGGGAPSDAAPPAKAEKANKK